MHATARRVRGVFFPISEWFPAFVLTLVVEAPIVLVLAWPSELGIARLLILVTTVNLATHLAVWYVLTQLFDVGTTGYVVAAEGWAIAAEAVFYVAAVRGLGVRRGVLIAVTANAASFAAGRLIGAFSPDLLG